MTWVQTLLADNEGFKLYQQESTILNVTEAICELMQDQGVSRVELAHRIGKNKSQISQLLNGEANMTLRTLSDLLLSLGHSLEVRTVPIVNVPNLVDDSIESVAYPKDSDWRQQDHYWNTVVAIAPATSAGTVPQTCHTSLAS